MSYRLVDCLLAGTRWKEFHLVPANKQSADSVWHITDAVCTVVDSWWWKRRPSQTCKVIFNKLENCASGWFYYRNSFSLLINPWQVTLQKKINSSKEISAVWPQQTRRHISQNHHSFVDLQYQQLENLGYIQQGLYLCG
jgi:hypothetical protein